MELVAFFVGQSVVILGAIVTAYVKTQVALAELRVHMANVHETTQYLKEDHKGLLKKVDGISRHVERLDAARD